LQEVLPGSSLTGYSRYSVPAPLLGDLNGGLWMRIEEQSCRAVMIRKMGRVDEKIQYQDVTNSMTTMHTVSLNANVD
jgi:hypothetical protein